MHSAKIIVSSRTKDEFLQVLHNVEQTVKPIHMPFVTHFECATAEQNIQANAKIAAKILACEEIFLRAVMADEVSRQRFSDAKRERRAFFHTGLQIVLCPEQFLDPVECIKLSTKGNVEARPDLVKFYREWLGVYEATNENNRLIGEKINADRNLMTSYLCKN